MRNAFEAWAQRDGHIVRRREDKPEEYLVFETQRRWVIWQAALAHGRAAVALPKPPAAKPAPKDVVAVGAQKSPPASPATGCQNAPCAAVAAASPQSRQ